MNQTIENHNKEYGRIQEEMLAHWLSVMEVYRHVLVVLCQQLPKTSRLVETSTKTLSDNFINFATDIKKQSEIVAEISELAGSLDIGNERVTIEEFTDLFATTLDESIKKILFVSKRAITMIYALDESIKNMASIETFVSDISNITKKANLLALNASIEAARAGEAGRGFAVVANEVKEVSNTIRQIADSVNQRINIVKDGVKEGYAVLQDVATTDMSDTMLAQDKLSNLMQSMVKQKNQFSKVLQNSAKTSEEISNTISSMVVNLQFQDRTTQYVESSVRMLEYMNSTIEKLKLESVISLPQLANIEANSEAVNEVSKLFNLSEFEKLFKASLCGIATECDPEMESQNDSLQQEEIVELF